LQKLNYKEYLKVLLSLNCPKPGNTVYPIQKFQIVLKYNNLWKHTRIVVIWFTYHPSVCPNYLSTGVNSGTGSCLSE